MSTGALPTFEIGLTMAGAVSAGAYSAGVLDFLIEALDALEAAQDEARRTSDDPRAWPVPGHQVLLRAISGASAGGMTAAIAAITLGREITPVRSDDAAGTALRTGSTGNALFDSWVQNIDISDLLSLSDLGAPPLVSALNSSKLQFIVDEVLSSSGSTSKRRGWVSEPLPVRLTVGNLTGVPYRLEFNGSGGAGLDMMAHGDYAGFKIEAIGGTTRPAAIPDRPLASPPDRGRWAALGTAALASGAFPVALQPRIVRGEIGAYLDKLIEVTQVDGASHMFRAPPNWPHPAPDPYDLLCVDGGIIDNEPLELVRRILSPEGHAPRDGLSADRAVLMIDPFPDVLQPETPPAAPGLVNVILPLLSAWKNQSRFKPGDLVLAAAEDTYSRFLIAPSGGNAPAGAKAPIASGGLGGFLGFFHRAYRTYDFMLGRRNCQQFLLKHFALPADNPLFAKWRGRVPLYRQHVIADEKGDHLPIIPLVTQRLRDEQRLPPWPADLLDRKALKSAVAARLTKVFKTALKQAGANWFTGLLGSALWSLMGESKLTGLIEKALDGALKDQKLTS